MTEWVWLTVARVVVIVTVCIVWTYFRWAIQWRPPADGDDPAHPIMNLCRRLAYWVFLIIALLGSLWLVQEVVDLVNG